MRKQVLIFWRRTVVVKQEEPKPAFPPYVRSEATVVRRAPREKWWLWWRVLRVLRIKKYHFPRYVPPRPVVPVQVTTVIVGRGARRERWRWRMLFTRRGARMTIPEWIDDKRAAWLEWPVTWKLGMGIPGALVGWLFSVQMGWSLRPCLFFGALFGMFVPLIVLNFIEAVFIFSALGIIFGAIYWAFGDEETGAVLGKMGAALWSGVVKLWHTVFG